MNCLSVLKASATNGYMHESFSQDSVDSYTRPWFAWANSLFGDMLIDLMDRHPELILHYYFVCIETILFRCENRKEDPS